MRLDNLALGPESSKVTLTVKKEAQIAATCQLGLAALADFPGLVLTVAPSISTVRDPVPC